MVIKCESVSCYMCLLKVVMFQTNSEVAVTFRATDGKTSPVSLHCFNCKCSLMYHCIQTFILLWKAVVHFGYGYDCTRANAIFPGFMGEYNNNFLTSFVDHLFHACLSDILSDPPMTFHHHGSSFINLLIFLATLNIINNNNKFVCRLGTHTELAAGNKSLFIPRPNIYLDLVNSWDSSQNIPPQFPVLHVSKNHVSQSASYQHYMVALGRTSPCGLNKLYEPSQAR